MSSKITAPRGTQDLFPPETGRWNELESRIHVLARRYGYGEIRTPMFESTELFVRGVGETSDIVEKEMYTFEDKGGRSMTLRPEWTAPVMRAALQQNLFAQGPQRLYYIGPIFRYERPQAGRYRQAHQFGIECTGYSGPEADVEVISLAMHLFRSYGLTPALNLNSIGDENCRPAYRQALLEHFRPHAHSLSEDAQRRLERNPLRLLDSKAPQDQPFLDGAPIFEEHLCDACREHFETVKRFLTQLGIPYTVNPRIVRGLDYYSRTVFEFVSDALGAQSTVCAGGRYDDLIRSLGGPSVPAVGFGLGLERLLLTIQAAGADAELERTGIQVIALGAQARSVLVILAALLRYALAIPIFMDFDDRKLLAHLKTADRNNARYALIVGSDELQQGQAVLRDLAERTDARVSLGKDLVPQLVEMVGS
ncbi:MAG TPA: histidine--tRNA ligase [Candidatus Baltobacteraceae bacterium]|nr:histidine--tRNA ligase [Candidatus Baltobacteraceae bacterium]